MLVYCFEHEQMVSLEEGSLCTGHVYSVLTEFGGDIEFHCMTPDDYAFCPPPENDWDLMPFEQWAEWIEINRPSDEEILVSDLLAGELREELEQA